MWLVVLVALLVLAVLAELAVTTLGRSRLERALAPSLGPDVSVVLDDRPVIVALARRRLTHVRIRARGVPVGDAGEVVTAIEELIVDLDGVTLARGAGEVPVAVAAERGRFEARLTQQQVEALADPPSYVTELELAAGRLWVRTVGVRVATTVTAEDGQLVVTPSGRGLASLPFGSLRIDLPELPGGAVVEELETRDGHVVVRGPLDGDRLLPDG